MLGLSYGGGLAPELYRRHPALPRSLILASAYAGWAGSLPAEIIELRLLQDLREADRPRSGGAGVASWAAERKRAARSR